MKKLIIILIGIFLIPLFSQPTFAKSPQRYRWEGAIIGLGAAILGSAIIHDRYPPRHYDRRHPPRHYRPPPSPRRYYSNCEYYEYERFWVPPTYRETLIPGYYDQSGRWIPDRWRRWTVRPGHWEERRICRSDR